MGTPTCFSVPWVLFGTQWADSLLVVGNGSDIWATPWSGTHCGGTHSPEGTWDFLVAHNFRTGTPAAETGTPGILSAMLCSHVGCP